MEIGEIELNLSLSLNGRFGLDPPRPKDKLARSSSSLLLEVPTADEVDECGRGLTAQMARSCSLLAMHASVEEEEEEGWKKRKETQSLKRMEVKRRRMEKQRITNGANPQGPGTTGVRFRREPDSAWSRSGSRGRGGSSGVSSKSNLPQDKGRKASAVASPPFRRSGPIDSKSAEQMWRSVLEEMPCVSAKIDGPNGGRIEGFLFRYRKGEGIKIVCICHGRFLSPAEFVKHAGGSGSDITHPLKHIIVCPPSW